MRSKWNQCGMNKRLFSSTILCVMLSSIMASTAYSQTTLYQWVDENGVKHFSQQPPPDAPDLQATDLKGAPVVSGGEPRPFISNRSTTQKQDETSADRAQAESEVSRKDPERCAKARESIATLRNSPRVRLQDEETGEYNYIDDEKRQEQLEAWQQRQETYC